MTSLNLAEQAVQHFRYWQEEGAEALEEALEIFEAERSNADDERRQRQDSQREYQSQSRRRHDMLRDERHRRWEQESQLRDERNRRIEYEKQLRGDHGDYEQQARAEAAYRSAPYDPTVAKLLGLAIYSESDSEAMAAFAKARSLHHQER
jgi:hypothetical protein